MPPVYGFPNYDFLDDASDEAKEEDGRDIGLTRITLWYMAVLIGLFVLWLLVFFCLRLLTLRQKTRSSQQRRTYMGSRRRPSDSQTEPTIYVSPANLPPPPKYEAMAPPSYEEVVGIHYPNYQPQIQPITQPISLALAQSSNCDTSTTSTASTTSTTSTTSTNTNTNTTNTDTNTGNTVPSTVIIVNEERTPVPIASS